MLLKDIVGQSGIKKALQINIDACKMSSKPLPHSLFYGFAGGGKTTFANAIAVEMGGEFQEANGAALSSVKSILPFLMRIKENSVLFIDEIHSCGKKVLDYLLTAMEQFKVTVGDTTHPIPKFTLIGATTNPGLLIKPLRDRFVLKYSIQPYSNKEMLKIVTDCCQRLTPMAAEVLVRASKNVPRIAKNYLTLINNYAIVNGKTVITDQYVLICLELMGVRADGLDKDDLEYLRLLKQIQPAGITTLAASTGFSRDQIENLIEPYLLTKGVIKRTPKGRVLIENKN